MGGGRAPAPGSSRKLGPRCRYGAASARGVRASPQVPWGQTGTSLRPSCVRTARGSGRPGGSEQSACVGTAAHRPLLALPGKPPTRALKCVLASRPVPSSRSSTCGVGGVRLDCPRQCLFLPSLFSPVCLQSRQCRETPSWSWRVGPWPLSPPGTASWKPVSPFPRSPGKTGPARARAVLSVCNTPVRGGICFAG